MDQANALERLLTLLADNGVRYCVIGGQAVNAYAEPLVSLDLDVALAAGELERIESALGEAFNVQRFPHSLNVSAAGRICVCSLSRTRVTATSLSAPRPGTCLA